MQQEALRLDQQDVEAVLEATCGDGGAMGGRSSLWGVCSPIPTMTACVGCMLRSAALVGHAVMCNE